MLSNSWIASDTLEMDEDISRCIENVCSSPIRISVVSLIFIISIGVTQLTPSAVILGTLLPVALGAMGTFQGSQQERTYINNVISNTQDSNKSVAYSILEAYNGKQEEKTSEEGMIVKKRFNVSSNTVVYGSLGTIGVAVMLVSTVVSFVKPLFDVNVAYVLLPLSLVYLAMIGVDYWARGRDNALS